MSATGRGAKRAENDYYPTPPESVFALLDEIGPITSSPILEPCAGDGAIVRAVNHWMEFHGHATPEWIAYDIKPRADWIRHGDGLCLMDDAPMIISNPPFNLAEEFVRSFESIPRSIWLLRLLFLGSAKRAEWLRRLKPNVYVLPDRPSFTGNGKTDMTEYAWFEFGETACGRLTVLRSK